MLKRKVKRFLLRKRGIICDRRSDINYGVLLNSNFKHAVINNSQVHITSMGDGCTFEHILSYGDVRLGNYVSISGPGTVLHAEDGKIVIGNFCSIAQNVTIQQFNHNIKRPTTYAIQYMIFNHSFLEDVVSKGDIVIEEDVWIGSNAVILSGVHIGRGAVIAAGAVVSEDVAPYSIVGGVPAREIKKRFSQEQINILEKSRWWTWNREKIYLNRKFFLHEVGTEITNNICKGINDKVGTEMR